MENIYRFGRSLRTILRYGLSCFAITILLLCAALAQQPIKYTAFTITDGQLGSWSFHNARVILTFVSNTDNVKSGQVIFGQNVDFNDVGNAHITIVGDDKTVQATFDPGQIFVSVDQSNTGVGFGSCSPPDCSGLSLVPIAIPPTAYFQPVYPLGVSDGTAFLANDDLIDDGGFSGRSWSCIDFAMSDSAETTFCPPSVALNTDKGDLYLFQRYQEYDHILDFPNTNTVAANAAFFFADTSPRENTLPFTLFAPSTQNPSGSIIYNLFFISDVYLGAQKFPNAKINLSFRSHPSNVGPLPGTDPNAYINKKGTARVVITAGSQTISAEIAPDQVYVFFNPGISSVGFGSYAPDHSLRLAYPVSLTGEEARTQLVEAVSDILNNPMEAQFYSPETQELAKVTDLKHPTVLADFVSSCTSFTLEQNIDVLNSDAIICDPQAQPAGLMTDKGLLYIPQILNGGWGIFWSSFNPPENDD